MSDWLKTTHGELILENEYKPSVDFTTVYQTSQKMLLYVFAFLSGLMFIETVHSKPSKGRLPLLNNLKAPLVAEIDVASINKELKEYIDNDIIDGLNASATRVEQLTAKFEDFQKQAENEIEILVNEKINAKLDQMTQHKEAQVKKFTNRLDIMNATTIRDRDCTGIKGRSKSKSGIFTINPSNGTDIKVYCNMEVDGGGWTVIQRRVDGTTDFYLGWQEYKAGFGDLEKNFWLGNQILHLFTSNGRYELRVDLLDLKGNTLYAVYKTFSVGSESTQYKLTVGEYSGTAGDGLAYHNSQKFSTKDRDNDDDERRDCAVLAKGGWWYKGCYYANLNGVYRKGNQKTWDDVLWSDGKGVSYSLYPVFARMMIRRY